MKLLLCLIAGGLYIFMVMFLDQIRQEYMKMAMVVRICMFQRVVI